MQLPEHKGTHSPYKPGGGLEVLSLLDLEREMDPFLLSQRIQNCRFCVRPRIVESIIEKHEHFMKWQESNEPATREEYLMLGN